MIRFYSISCTGERNYMAPAFAVVECAAEQGYLVSAPIEDVGKDEEIPFV